MFLATTALEDFWDRSKEILFLGSWCLTSCAPLPEVQRPYHLMPSPWDDRPRYYRAASYVDTCSEALLWELHQYLNGVHGTNHSERYWRIVLGPWLILYANVIYDRLVHLQAAFAEYRNLETIAMLESSYRVPSDFNEAATFVACDAYNLQIFSQLLKLMNYSFVEKPFSGPFGGPSKIACSWRERVLSFAERSMQAPFQSRAKATVRGTNLSPIQSWRLAWATGFRALPLDFSLAVSFAQNTAVFNEARLGLSTLPWNDEFQRMLTALLPTHLPTLYLEGYRVADARLSKVRCPRLFVSGYAWHGDEEMKFYAARAAESGTRLAAVQHGGGYGVYRSAPQELHERRLSDRFLTWGWADDRKNYGNLANPRFSQLQRQMRPSAPGRKIVFIGTGQPRYLYRFQSSPVGTQWDSYYDWQHTFLDRLPDDLRRVVVLRPYPESYGHRGELRIRNSFPSVICDDSRRPVHERLGTAKAVVIDHLATTLLETLAANIPTILFWDPNRWEVRDEAETYFESLRQVGILWHSPERAAEKLVQIYDEPGSWWDSDDLQTVRRQFVTRYALVQQDWISSWVNNLDAIVAGNV